MIRFSPCLFSFLFLLLLVPLSTVHLVFVFDASRAYLLRLVWPPRGLFAAVLEVGVRPLESDVPLDLDLSMMVPVHLRSVRFRDRFPMT